MAKKRGNIKSKKTKFSNKLFYALIIIGIFFLIATGIYAILTLIDIGHSQEEIIVSINGCDVTLNNAISGEWLKGLSTSTLSGSDCLSESEFPKKYHLASEIIVTINSYTLTLQDAINQNYFKGTGIISSSSPVPSRGHLADEVEVTIDGTKKTLQNALSELKYTCVANYNQDCPSGDASCINLGKIQCEGTCSGTYKTASTSCGTNMECDGEGNCLSVVTCETHDSVQCYDNDVYWFDSCGVMEEKKEECDSDYCGGWGEEYCVGEVALQDRICHDLGCSEDACFDVTYTETREVFDNPGDSKIFCTKLAIEEEADNGKVICTELYNLGYLDEETYKMDIEYAHSHFSSEAIRGYQAWAISVVKAMRKNPEESEEFVIPFVYSFMEEIAYRAGKTETGNEVGALFLDKGVPLFERVGVLINEPDWRSLFDETWIDALYDTFKFAIGDNLFSTENTIRNLFEEKDKKYDDLVRNYFTEEKIKEMYYDAKEKSNGSDMGFVNALLENLEEAVEEIESIIEAIEKSY